MYLETLCIIESRRFILLGISSGFREFILAACWRCPLWGCMQYLTYYRGAKPRTDSKAPGHYKGALQSSERHRNPAAIIHSAVVWDETSQLSVALWGFIFVFVVFPTCSRFPDACIDDNFKAKDVISKSITLHRCNVLWLLRWLKVAPKITLAWLRSLRMPPSFRGMPAQQNLTRTECIVFVSVWDN